MGVINWISMGMMMRKELMGNDIVGHDWNNSDEEEFVNVQEVDSGVRKINMAETKDILLVDC